MTADAGEMNHSDSTVSHKLETVIEAFSPSLEPTSVSRPLPSGRVFLIHGRDFMFREEVARFIERLGVSVIILDEMPSRGRTVIEKFESFSGINYVVALLSGDIPHGDSQLIRHNAIFELGFFTAKLGRSRVAIMAKSGTEIPSDIQGILYIAMDSTGGWKIRLARELAIAGLPIDLNKAF